VKSSFGADGVIDAHFYPYDNDTAFKVRRLPKSFSWVGRSTGLFGRDKFNSGGKRLVICEGELDTLSVAKASFDKYEKIYPVVGLSSSAMMTSLIEEREWIRSFDEVIIMFDEDDAGRNAVESAVKIIGIDKARIAKLPHNDASDVLVLEGAKVLFNCVWDAARVIPSGIIGKEALWNALVHYNSLPSIPYPTCLDGLNSKLKGMRDGEIALFISGTGSGKSTILREIILEVLETTDEKVGVISLEESPAETARKLAGMVINRNPAEDEIPLAELKPGFDAVFGDDRVILLDHQGAVKDGSITDKIEYMCLMGCKKIFIDHITILVSEGVEKLTGNEAQDRIMNDLLTIVKKYPAWIGLVSHLRKVAVGGKSFEEGKLPTLDDIRGSGSVKQISFDIIAFARDMTNEDPVVRNTILMRVLKARYTGLTGDVPGVYYKHETGRLISLNDIPDEQFTAI
jgi:twinkle protein